MEPKDLIEWSDIHDPKGEIDMQIAMNWNEVAEQYLPKEIQDIIDKEGVNKMVSIVNEHFKHRLKRSPVILLSYAGNKKCVCQY